MITYKTKSETRAFLTFMILFMFALSNIESKEKVTTTDIDFPSC